MYDRFGRSASRSDDTSAAGCAVPERRFRMNFACRARAARRSSRQATCNSQKFLHERKAGQDLLFFVNSLRVSVFSPKGLFSRHEKTARADGFSVFVNYIATMPEVVGNDGSVFVIASSLQAAPSGWFLPASHASTVFTDTPMYLANKD